MESHASPHRNRAHVHYDLRQIFGRQLPALRWRSLAPRSGVPKTLVKSALRRLDSSALPCRMGDTGVFEFLRSLAGVGTEVAGYHQAQRTANAPCALVLRNVFGVALK